MPGTPLPLPILQVIDANGAPVNGALLNVYLAGTSTRATTYQDADLHTQNDNPVEANSAGRFPQIFIEAITVDLVCTDADGNPIWSAEGIGSTALGSSSLGTGFPFFGDASSPVVLTAYPSGATANKLHAGSVIVPIDAANLEGEYALRGMLMGDGASTVSAALVNLSDGSPDTPIVTISSNSTTGAIQTSATVTFPAGGATKNFGVKVKVDTGTGFAWGVVLVKVSS